MSVQRRSELEQADHRADAMRVWAAIELALQLDVARSILHGNEVLAGRLDSTVLRRALRGAALPDPNDFIQVYIEDLDAIIETGPLRRLSVPAEYLP
jgi:hypothetical protein